MALKKLRFPLLLIILVSICQQQSAKEILIDYEFKLEKPIRNFYLKYFYDIKDKYFVDAGAFDPTHKSTTANLVAQGWNGIFIEASP